MLEHMILIRRIAWASKFKRQTNGAYIDDQAMRLGGFDVLPPITYNSQRNSRGTECLFCQGGSERKSSSTTTSS